jgi:hypothetical protein
MFWCHNVPSSSLPTASSKGTPSLSAKATSGFVLVGGELPESGAVVFLYIAVRASLHFKTHNFFQHFVLFTVRLFPHL